MRQDETKKEEMVLPMITANSTLVDCAEKIIRILGDDEENGLDGCLQRGKDAIEQFQRMYAFTEYQVVVCCYMMNEGRSPSLMREIARALRLTNLGLRKYEREMEELTRKRYVFTTSSRHGVVSYVLNPRIMEAMYHNQFREPLAYSEFQNINWLRAIDRIVGAADADGDIAEDNLKHDIMEVLEGTLHLPVSRAILDEQFEYEDLAIVIGAFGGMYSSYGCTQNMLDNLLSDPWAVKDRWFHLGEKGDPLFDKGWIEPCCTDDGYASSHYLRIPLAKLQELMSDVANVLGDNHEEDLRKLRCIQPDDIKAKQLYYNPSEEGTVNRLVGLLEDDNYKQTCKRLAEKGFRRGFTALLYGTPGTGKTETVMQIAKATGRQIRQVKISEVRDKYVGETEKRIQKIFDGYRLMVAQAEKRGEKTPILLFNEADGVLHKRFDLSGTNPTVAEMENAMQNIILEEMEKLDGILICTSNLTEQLDPAMERRFLFKIMLSQPKADVAAHIWEEMIPELTHDEATELAREFNFSGGQIENIARKQAIDYILAGKEMDVQYVKRLCKEEVINNKNNRKVGF